MAERIRSFKYTEHPCHLQEPTPRRLEIHFNGKVYSFHPYINDVGRYVVLCNTVGCDKFHGEGANWWFAVNDCMTKILQDQNKT